MKLDNASRTLAQARGEAARAAIPMVPRADFARSTPRRAAPRRLATITDMCRRLGLTPRAIRHYEALGLIHCARTAANTRQLDDAAQSRLEAIADLRATGFDLASIGRILEHDDIDRAVCAHLGKRLERLEAERLQLERVLSQRRARLGEQDR